jgi:hypothetical protein
MKYITLICLPYRFSEDQKVADHHVHRQDTVTGLLLAGIGVRACFLLIQKVSGADEKAHTFST